MTKALKDQIRQKIIADHGALFSKGELNFKDFENITNSPGGYF